MGARMKYGKRFRRLDLLLAEVTRQQCKTPIPLHGVDLSDDGVISSWAWHDGAAKPVGPIDLTKCVWGYATVASVAGAVVTVDASPTLGTSGTLRAWDVSAGASLGDVAYTRSGTDVTLTAGALGSLAAGDVLYEVVGGRTGALDISAAGEIRPAAGASVQPRAAGLLAKGGVVLALPVVTCNAGMGVTFEGSMTLSTAPVTNDVIGVGVRANSGICYLAGPQHDATPRWMLGACYGPSGAPTSYAASGTASLITAGPTKMLFTMGRLNDTTPSWQIELYGHNVNVAGSVDHTSYHGGTLSGATDCDGIALAAISDDGTASILVERIGITRL